MSPEQTRGDRDIDPRSDIWSLGVVLFEMVTGVRPFTGEPQQIMEKIARGPIWAISDLVRNADPRLVKIVSRCLQRDPRDRFDSAAEIGELLEPLRQRESEESSSSAAMNAPPLLSPRLPSRPDAAFAEEPAPSSVAAARGSARSPALSGADLLGPSAAPSPAFEAGLAGWVGTAPVDPTSATQSIAEQLDPAHIGPWHASTPSNSRADSPASSRGFPGSDFVGGQPACDQIPPLKTIRLRPDEWANEHDRPRAPRADVELSLVPFPHVRPEESTVPPIEARDEAVIAPAKAARDDHRFRRLGLIAGIVGAGTLLSAILYLALARQPTSHAAEGNSFAERVAARTADPSSTHEPHAEPTGGAATSAQPAYPAQTTSIVQDLPPVEGASSTGVKPTPPPTITASVSAKTSPPPAPLATSRPVTRDTSGLNRENPFAVPPTKKRCIFMDEKGNPCPKYQPPSP